MGDADDLPGHLQSVLRIPKSSLKADTEPSEALSEPEQIRRGLASLISQGNDGISLQISFRSNQPTLSYTSRECCPEAAEYTASNLLQSGVPLWYALLLAHKIAVEMYPPLPLLPGASLDDTSDEDDANNPTPPASPVRNNIAKRAHALLATFVEEVLQQSDEELLREKPTDAYPVALYTAKNQRRKMEDRHLIIPRLGLCQPNTAEPEDRIYAVFDGHGGAEVAGYLATHFLDHFVHAPNFSSSVTNALGQAFASCDRALMKRAQKTHYRGGSTAVVAVLRDSLHLTVAWAGDSQAALLRLPFRTSTLLTTPVHSPNSPPEYHRIIAAGGSIVNLEGELRVQGCLNLTRSFGDISLKPDIVIVQPEIAQVELGDEDLMLVLGCDGLWDHITVQEALTAIHDFTLTHDISQFGAVGRCLGELAKANDSSDNITVVVVALKPLPLLWHRFHSME